MPLGPEDAPVAASLDFKDGETAAGVEVTIARLERSIKGAFPQGQRLFLEVTSTGDVKVEARRGG
jgi:hypothetical protein